MTNLTDRQIIMLMSDEDADKLLTLAKRHLRAVKQLIGQNVPTKDESALRAEIEACRRERERILNKYR